MPAPRKYDRADCRAALRRVADTLGHAPTKSEYSNHRQEGDPSLSPYARRYDTWFDALADAGIDVDPRTRYQGRPTRRDCIRSVRYVGELLGHLPSPDEYRDAGVGPSVPTIYDRFGSWGRVRGLAAEDGPMAWTDEELREVLTEAAAWADGRLTTTAYTDYCDQHRRESPSIGTIQSRLGDGSWTDAVAAVVGRSRCDED